MYLPKLELTICRLKNSYLTIKPLFHSLSTFHKTEMCTRVVYVFFFLPSYIKLEGKICGYDT